MELCASWNLITIITVDEIHLYLNKNFRFVLQKMASTFDTNRHIVFVKSNFENPEVWKYLTDQGALACIRKVRECSLTRQFKTTNHHLEVI